MLKYYISLAFIILCSISIVSCSFDDTIAEYTNIHDSKSDNYVPTGPNSLIIPDYTDTYINLKWTDNSLGEKGFIIERSELPTDNFTPIDTTSENATTYTDYFDIRPGINYYYRIRAAGLQNKSTYSNTAGVTVEIMAPSNLLLFGTGNTIGSYALYWTSRCNFTQKYIIQSRVPDESQEFKTIGETSPSSQLFNLPNLDENKSYEFRVFAATEKNTSSPSNVITVVYGFKPEALVLYTKYSRAKYVEFSPVSNELVATSEAFYEAPFAVYNIDQLKINYTVEGLYAGFPKYNPAGNIIALGTSENAQDPTVSRTIFFNAQNGDKIRTLSLATRSLDFSSDGSRLAVGAYSTPYGHPDLVGVIDMNTYKTIWSSSNYRVTKVIMTPDGKRLVAVVDASSSDYIAIFDAASGALLNTLSSEDYGILDCKISYDGNLLAFSTSGSKHNIKIYNMNTLAKIREINAYATAIAFTHDSKYLAAGYTSANIFRLSDGSDMGEIGAGFMAGYGISSFSFNNNDSMLADGCAENDSRIIKISKGWRSR
ncbi:MAG: hypothetical protein ACM3S2_13315 [Ignavibacteriales bacterium]